MEQKHVLWRCLAIVLLLAAMVACQPAKPKAKVLQWDKPPAMQIDPTKQYFATLKTEKGDIRIQLFADKAPQTVNNFVFLAGQHFYDNITFHRVIPGFMAQTGDPTGTGGGGPGYTVEDEFSPDLKHDQPGMVSMANKGQPHTGGSQFFMTYAPAPHLDGHHTIFGRVVEGMDVLEQLAERRPSQNPEAPPGDKLLSVEMEER